MNDDSALFRLFNEIGIISQLSEKLFESVMPKGMTLAQFIILNHFERLGGERSPAELASIFQVTRATMTSTLQKLAGKGLVDIKPNLTDGRAKRVTISESGKMMRRDCIAAVRPQIARIEALFAQARIDALLPGLGDLRQVLDQDRQPNP